MTLQEFRNKYLGGQVEYHSFGGEGTYNQCVDLVNQYIVEVLRLTPIIGTHAKDFPTKYDKSQFDFVANTPTGVPVVGDIVVWNGRVGGGAGHIAIFIFGDVNNFTSLDQNWSQKERVTIENHNYNNVSGWLHPKETMADPLQECLRQHTLLVDETTQLKKIIEALKADEAAHQVDVNNMKLALEEEIKVLKVELDGKLLLETQLQQERDGRREDNLKWEMKKAEWEGEIQKIKQQLASEDLSLRDYKVLIQALMKKILRDIESLKK